jgi:hypothetical protein
MKSRKFVIKMDCDNSAFDDNCLGEIKRAVAEALKQLDEFIVRDRVDDEAFRFAGYVRDVNGNAVGSWSLRRGLEESSERK